MSNSLKIKVDTDELNNLANILENEIKSLKKTYNYLFNQIPIDLNSSWGGNSKLVFDKRRDMLADSILKMINEYEELNSILKQCHKNYSSSDNTVKSLVSKLK